MKIVSSDNYPNFLCVGAQKSATSTFADMIQMHSEVFAPPIKELHYFDQQEYSLKECGKYCKFFKNTEQYKIRAEFTPNYLSNKEAPHRILELLGNEVKILMILRNPLDRAFSSYLVSHNNGTDLRSFEDTFYEDAQNMVENAADVNYYGYFGMGLYSKQVQQYLNLFKHVKIILFEDFIYNTNFEMAGIFEFLGIKYEEISLLKANETKAVKSIKLYFIMAQAAQLLNRYGLFNRGSFIRAIGAHIRNLNVDNTKPKPTIDPAFAKVLQDYYLDDICELEKLIGRDLTAWKTKY